MKNKNEKSILDIIIEMKRMADEIVIEAEDFIKRQKCYGNQDKIQRV